MIAFMLLRENNVRKIIERFLLNQQYLNFRLVNCARKSLHNFTSHLPDVNFSHNLNVEYSNLLTSR